MHPQPAMTAAGGRGAGWGWLALSAGLLISAGPASSIERGQVPGESADQNKAGQNEQGGGQTTNHPGPAVSGRGAIAICPDVGVGSVVEGGSRPEKLNCNHKSDGFWRDAYAAGKHVDWAAVSGFTSIISALGLIWSLRETRRNARAQLRAYVVIRHGDISAPVAGERLRATVVLANCGPTPADRLNVGCGLLLRPPGVNLGLLVNHDLTTSFPLGAGSEYLAVAASDDGLSSDDVRHIEAGTLIAFVAITGGFTDVFGERHSFQFLLERTADGGLRPVTERNS